MPKTEQLKNRLLQIASAVKNSGHAAALLALGSCGSKQARMDEYSDLDFFVICRDGRKSAFLDDLGWLTAAAPAGYYFRNTADGYKFLYADGIFCEFAVFTESEWSRMDGIDGTAVWQSGRFGGLKPPGAPAAGKRPPDQSWMLGEILTNLFVGLGRFRRGEKLSAYKFVQNYAVDQLLALMQAQNPAAGKADPFDAARRVESRHVIDPALLSSFIQGYEKTPQSALAILRFVEKRFDVNPCIKAQIKALAET